jgi:asparagine synthase (glutamine-hydrolysing)
LKECQRIAQQRIAGLASYRRAARWKRERANARRSWFTPELCGHVASDETIGPAKDLNAALAYSVYQSPLPLYLRIEDRNSMAHSVEARLPFLDYRLVTLCFSLSPEWHLRGPWNKYVLREAMRGRIPESVRRRIEKMGFPTPARSWFADTLHSPLLDLLNSRAARERGIYDTEAILSDIRRHRRGEIDVTQRIAHLAQFESWCELAGSRDEAKTSTRAYA